MQNGKVENTKENITENTTREFGAILQDESANLKSRFRALFELRNINTDAAVREIEMAFSTDSVLLKHELAYVLGQMQNTTALPFLRRVLESEQEDVVVRHEAAEAIATFGNPEYICVLEKYTGPNTPKSLAETCLVGIQNIRNNGSAESAFGSFDPAPPAEEASIETLSSIYNSPNSPLFERYTAMFALRDLGSKEAVHVLGSLLAQGSGSDLMDHEIAFVFGQLCSTESISYLEKVLSDESRHEMVRHEAAEALGNIGSPQCIEILERHALSPNKLVRESIEVGLDMAQGHN